MNNDFITCVVCLTQFPIVMTLLLSSSSIVIIIIGLHCFHHHDHSQWTWKWPCSGVVLLMIMRGCAKCLVARHSWPPDSITFKSASSALKCFIGQLASNWNVTKHLIKHISFFACLIHANKFGIQLCFDLTVVLH